MPGPEQGPAASCFSLELVFPTQPPHSRRAGRASLGPRASGRAGGQWVSSNPFENPTDNRDFAALSNAVPNPCEQQFPTQRGKGTSPPAAQHHCGESDHHPLPAAPPQSTWSSVTAIPCAAEATTLPSFLEHSFHEWAAKPPEPAGRVPEPLASPGLGLQAGSGRCPGERFSQQAPFCFHLE